MWQDGGVGPVNSGVVKSVRIVRLKEVVRRTGVSRSRLYELMKAGLFPQRLKLGLRAVGWLESDVEAWIQARIPLHRA